MIHLFRTFANNLTFIGGLLSASGVLALAWLEHHDDTGKQSRQARRGLILLDIVVFMGGLAALIGSRVESNVLVKKEEEISSLTENQLAWTTGGENFIKVRPMMWVGDSDEVFFTIWNPGTLPAYDVIVQIVDNDARGAFIKSHENGGRLYTTREQIDAASVRATRLEEVPADWAIPNPPKYSLKGMNSRSFYVDVWARNGYVRYYFCMSKVNGTWLTASRKDATINGKREPPVESVPAGFPPALAHRQW